MPHEKAKRLAKEEGVRIKRKAVPSVPEGGVKKAAKHKVGEVVKQQLQKRRAKRRAKAQEKRKRRSLVADARQEATDEAREDVKEDLVSEFKEEKETRLRQRMQSRGLLRTEAEKQRAEQREQRNLSNLMGDTQDDPLSDLDQGLEDFDETMGLVSSQFSEFHPTNTLLDDSPTSLDVGSDLDLDLDGID